MTSTSETHQEHGDSDSTLNIDGVAFCEQGMHASEEPFPSIKCSDVVKDERAQKSKAAKESFERGKQAYGLCLIVMFAAVLLSFLPAVVTWLTHGVWYMNVIKKAHVNPFQKLVSAHAILALALLGFLVAQVATGATGKPGDERRAYHRIVGRYILSPLLIITLLFAVAAEISANMCCQEFSFFTMLTALVIMVTFSLGIRTARQKRYAEHKDWMLWTIVVTSGTGLSRVGMYVVQPYFECDSFLSDWPFFIAIFLSGVTAVICLYSIGRLYLRMNVAMVLVHVVVGSYAFVSSVMFSCPEGAHPDGDAASGSNYSAPP